MFGRCTGYLYSTCFPKKAESFCSIEQKNKVNIKQRWFSEITRDFLFSIYHESLFFVRGFSCVTQQPNFRVCYRILNLFENVVTVRFSAYSHAAVDHITRERYFMFSVTPYLMSLDELCLFLFLTGKTQFLLDKSIYSSFIHQLFSKFLKRKRNISGFTINKIIKL